MLILVVEGALSYIKSTKHWSTIEHSANGYYCTIFIHTNIYVYIHIYIYVYIHIYMYTCTRTYIQSLSKRLSKGTNIKILKYLSRDSLVCVIVRGISWQRAVFTVSQWQTFFSKRQNATAIFERSKVEDGISTFILSAKP